MKDNHNVEATNSKEWTLEETEDVFRHLSKIKQRKVIYNLRRFYELATSDSATLFEDPSVLENVFSRLSIKEKIMNQQLSLTFELASRTSMKKITSLAIGPIPDACLVHRIRSRNVIDWPKKNPVYQQFYCDDDLFHEKDQSVIANESIISQNSDMVEILDYILARMPSLKVLSLSIPYNTVNNIIQSKKNIHPIFRVTDTFLCAFAEIIQRYRTSIECLIIRVNRNEIFFENFPSKIISLAEMVSLPKLLHFHCLDRVFPRVNWIERSPNLQVYDCPVKLTLDDIIRISRSETRESIEVMKGLSLQQGASEDASQQFAAVFEKLIDVEIFFGTDSAKKAERLFLFLSMCKNRVSLRLHLERLHSNKIDTTEVSFWKRLSMYVDSLTLNYLYQFPFAIASGQEHFRHLRFLSFQHQTDVKNAQLVEYLRRAFSQELESFTLHCGDIEDHLQSGEIDNFYLSPQLTTQLLRLSEELDLQWNLVEYRGLDKKLKSREDKYGKMKHAAKIKEGFTSFTSLQINKK